MDLTNIYRTPHPNIKRIHLLLCSAWNCLQNWSYIMAQNNSQQIVETEITSCILPDYDGTKLAINSNRNHKEYANCWRLNSTQFNNWVTEEIKNEIKKKSQDRMKMKTHIPKSMRHNKGNCGRNVLTLNKQTKPCCPAYTVLNGVMQAASRKKKKLVSFRAGPQMLQYWLVWQDVHTVAWQLRSFELLSDWLWSLFH